MGWLDRLLGRQKTPPIPAGKGVGPGYAYPDTLDMRPPYIDSAETWASGVVPKLQQDADADGRYFAVPPDIPPEEWSRYTDDLARREQWPLEQQVSGQGWDAASPRKPMAPDPRWTPVEYQRLVRSPSAYRFERPFDVSSRRDLNGNHFSQADMAMSYPTVGGMDAVRSRRNTYRIEPPPYDANIVDSTAVTGTGAIPGVRSDIPGQTNISPDFIGGGSRGGYRLP